jgi:hypothetical protein
MSSQKEKNEILVHWKSLLSCLVVSLCAFQFGFDATVIGGLQAMPGFLEVIINQSPFSHAAALADEHLHHRYLGTKILKAPLDTIFPLSDNN